MKRTIRLTALVALLAGLALASCQKEDNNSSTASNGGNNGGGGNTPAGWVDLGLPSGLLWAECNLGATSPEEYGNYYAWGETQPKAVYNWSTYAYGNDKNALTKYCDNAVYGLNGFTDTLTILQAMDDAATAALGSGARMPTKEEWQELINNTTVEWTTMNGVNGCKYTGSNGNTLFLPSAGWRYGSDLYEVGIIGDYWSSSLYRDFPYRALSFYFHCDGYSDYHYQYVHIRDRYYGGSVRAVRQK